MNKTMLDFIRKKKKLNTMHKKETRSSPKELHIKCSLLALGLPSHSFEVYSVESYIIVLRKSSSPVVRIFFFYDKKKRTQNEISLKKLGFCKALEAKKLMEDLVFHINDSTDHRDMN